MERHEQVYHVEEYGSSHVSSQETNLFRNFSNLVLGGKPDAHWPKITMLTQKVMMACMESAENGSKEIEIA
jgi:predicted dehydrogenase